MCFHSSLSSSFDRHGRGTRSPVSLRHTSGWRNDGREHPVVDGAVSNPDEEHSNGHAPAGDVLHSIGSGLGGQLPESREVHI